MGYALAEAAVEAGWEVDLVSGPVSLPAPSGACLHSVMTGAEMFEAVGKLFGECDILIMTAALIDFRPCTMAAHKVKKDVLDMVVEMEPVIDVLATMGKRKTSQFIVGFAAETNDVEVYGRRKLETKNADYIVANQIGVEGSGFASDDNKIILLGRDGSREEMGPTSKRALGSALVAQFQVDLEARLELE
jgi:phosphopantothenoylcysteine decarboxylase/phosphopantothenate--cysteine ligase|tara:strand:- start:704 stop:1273 length:570 start_codon:yes stop_codon:yes gene_type:complete